MSIYEPQEDSELLEKEVAKHAKGIVLDVGTGSGIQAISAAKNKDVKYVVATDINEDALDKAGRNASKNKIKNIYFFISDLFSLFDHFSVDAKGKMTDNREIRKKNKSYNLMQFDTIIFNPPYLPQENKTRDIALEGGKKGYEVIEKFLTHLALFMKDNGQCLLVFSSHTKKDVIDRIITQQLFEFEELAVEKMFFEQLLVYRITKTHALKELSSEGFYNIKYFAHGKRGIIHTAFMKKKSDEIKVAIKTKKLESEAIGRIENESVWLKKLNKKEIGPKLVKTGELFMAYEFVNGEFFPDFIAKASKKDCIEVIKDVFEQCFEMDMMNIDKEEMHHPVKHIVVEKNGSEIKAVMLDFERTHATEKPKNVTQFSVYMVGDFVIQILKAKGIEVEREKVLEAARQYKHDMSKACFKVIVGCFK